MSPVFRGGLCAVMCLAVLIACGGERARQVADSSSSRRHAAVAASPTAAAPVASSLAGPGATCGVVKSAVGVPGVVTVQRGRVDCVAIRRVLAQYYSDLAAGRAPGIGGGGPVPVAGWTCVSGPATDPGSRCTKGDSSITVAYRR